MFTPPSTVRSMTTADQVHKIILDAIVTGDLVAGESLRDHEWAATLQVSRTPVREAIQRLETQGIADIAAARFTKLIAFDAAAAVHEAHGWAAVQDAVLRSVHSVTTHELLADLSTIRDEYRSCGPEARQPTGFAFFERLREAVPVFGLQLAASTSAYRLRLAAPQLVFPERGDEQLHDQIISALTDDDRALARRIFGRWAKAVRPAT
jgi:DNA-binding GntR family transcriptional regulator